MTHRILILGAGQVGSALGRAWTRSGHDVRYGVPDPTSAKYARLPRTQLQPAMERRDAEVIVVATPYAAARPALEALGDLTGALVIDCTNPLGMGAQGLELTVGFDNSGAERLAAALPGIPVFKTLNQTGAETMGDPSNYPVRPIMLVAGDDADRKPAVLQLVADLGFEAIDAGPLRAARLLEPLAMLWIDLALKRGQGRDFAFALVRRGERRP